MDDYLHDSRQRNRGGGTKGRDSPKQKTVSAHQWHIADCLSDDSTLSDSDEDIEEGDHIWRGGGGNGKSSVPSYTLDVAPERGGQHVDYLRLHP